MKLKILSIFLIITFAVHLSAAPAKKQSVPKKRAAAGNRSSSSKKIAAGAGSGIVLPLGDNKLINYAVPVTGGVQYPLSYRNTTAEADIYFWLIAFAKESYVKKYSVGQLSLGMRYYFDSTYNGFYTGCGLGYTSMKIETEQKVEVAGFTTTVSTDASDNFFTMVLKGGYCLNISSSLILDAGVRYDAIDFKFGDADVMGYVMASVLF